MYSCIATTCNTLETRAAAQGLELQSELANTVNEPCRPPVAMPNNPILVAKSAEPGNRAPSRFKCAILFAICVIVVFLSIGIAAGLGMKPQMLGVAFRAGRAHQPSSSGEIWSRYNQQKLVAQLNSSSDLQSGSSSQTQADQNSLLYADLAQGTARVDANVETVIDSQNSGDVAAQVDEAKPGIRMLSVSLTANALKRTTEALSNQPSEHQHSKIDTSASHVEPIAPKTAFRTKMTIVCQLAGEMGNNIGFLSYCLSLKMWLESGEFDLKRGETDIGIIIRHQDHSKWVRGASDMHRCFPNTRKDDFAAANTQDFVQIFNIKMKYLGWKTDGRGMNESHRLMISMRKEMTVK